jgi:hypothetical protein
MSTNCEMFLFPISDNYSKLEIFEEKKLDRISYNNKNKKNNFLEKKRMIVLNARGFKFEIMLDHMDRVPNSRLARIKKFIIDHDDSNKTKHSLSDHDFFYLDRLCDGYSENLNEFYFNKDPCVLNFILRFYETQINNDTQIHINFKNICVLSLEDEFRYWNIENYESLIKPCCLFAIEEEGEIISDQISRQKDILAEFSYKEYFDRCFFPKIREKIWNFMEKPKSSIFSKVTLLIERLFNLSFVICRITFIWYGFKLNDAQNKLINFEPLCNLYNLFVPNSILKI